MKINSIIPIVHIVSLCNSPSFIEIVYKIPIKMPANDANKRDSLSFSIIRKLGCNYSNLSGFFCSLFGVFRSFSV